MRPKSPYSLESKKRARRRSAAEARLRAAAAAPPATSLVRAPESASPESYLEGVRDALEELHRRRAEAIDRGDAAATVRVGEAAGGTEEWMDRDQLRAAFALRKRRAGRKDEEALIRSVFVPRAEPEGPCAAQRRRDALALTVSAEPVAAAAGCDGSGVGDAEDGANAPKDSEREEKEQQLQYLDVLMGHLRNRISASSSRRRTGPKGRSSAGKLPAAAAPDETTSPTPASPDTTTAEADHVAAADGAKPSLQGRLQRRAQGWSVRARRPGTATRGSVSSRSRGGAAAAVKPAVLEEYERWLPQRNFDETVMDFVLKDARHLIEAGFVNLDRHTSGTKSTILHTAAWFRKVHILALLLEHGADPNHQNLKGNTPVHFACEHAARGGREMAEACLMVLLVGGGDPHIKNFTGGESGADIFPGVAAYVERARAVREARARWAVGSRVRDQAEAGGGASSSLLPVAPARPRSGREAARMLEQGGRIFEQLKHLCEKPGTGGAQAGDRDTIPPEAPKLRGWGSTPHQNASDAVAAKRERNRSRFAREAAADADEKARKDSQPKTRGKGTDRAPAAGADPSARPPPRSQDELENYPRWLQRVSGFKDTLTQTREQRALSILEFTTMHERSRLEAEFLASWVAGTGVRLLNTLPHKLAADLMSSVYLRRLEPGETVCEAGSMPGALLMLYRGQCAVETRDGGGGGGGGATLSAPEPAEAGGTYGDTRRIDRVVRRRILWRKLLACLTWRRRRRELAAAEGRHEERRLLTGGGRAGPGGGHDQERTAHFADVVEAVLDRVCRHRVVARTRCVVLCVDTDVYESTCHNYRLHQRNEAVRLLHRSSLCKRWSYSRLRRMASTLQYAVYPAGSIVARQSDPCGSVWFVVSGSVTLSREAEVTRTRTCPVSWDQWVVTQSRRLVSFACRTLGPGDAVGSEALLRCPRYDYTARCAAGVGEVVLLRLRPQHFWHATRARGEMNELRLHVQHARERAAAGLHAFLARKYPQSHRQNPFPTVVWDPHAAPRSEPVFRSLRPGCVHVTYDPVLTRVRRASSPVSEERVLAPPAAARAAGEEDAASASVPPTGAASRVATPAKARRAPAPRSRMGFGLSAAVASEDADDLHAVFATLLLERREAAEEKEERVEEKSDGERGDEKAKERRRRRRSSTFAAPATDGAGRLVPRRAANPPPATQARRASLTVPSLDDAPAPPDPQRPRSARRRASVLTVGGGDSTGCTDAWLSRTPPPPSSPEPVPPSPRAAVARRSSVCLMPPKVDRGEGVTVGVVPLSPPPSPRRGGDRRLRTRSVCVGGGPSEGHAEAAAAAAAAHAGKRQGVVEDRFERRGELELRPGMSVVGVDLADEDGASLPALGSPGSPRPRPRARSVLVAAPPTERPRRSSFLITSHWQATNGKRQQQLAGELGTAGERAGEQQ